jgi:hypothetical protein
MRHTFRSFLTGLLFIGTLLTACTPSTLTSNNPNLTWLRITTYRSDGTSVPLPVILSGGSGGDRSFQSGTPVQVAAGTYDLKVDLAVPYIAKGLIIPAASQLDYPITLSDVKFLTKDHAGTPTPFKGFVVTGTPKTQQLAADALLLLPPGAMKFDLAPSDQPDATQPITFTLTPGQHLDYLVHSDLFGAGSLQASVTDTDGKPLTVSLRVYQKDKEDAAPYLTFKTSDTPPLLPEGAYVLNILTKIAVRKEITIARKQTLPLAIKMGTLTISAKDSNDTPVAPMIYLVADSEVQRLGKGIDDTFKLGPSFGLYTQIARVGTPFVVPQGVYDVMIELSKDSVQQVTVGDSPATVVLKQK